jgi:CBS domain-containing protein
MARYRDDLEQNRGFNPRNDRFQRERPWNYDNPFEERGRFEDDRPARFGRGRFGERADYDVDEPRYTEDYNRRSERDYDRDYDRGRRMQYGQARSRLRCRDIMTRELVVATRDTNLVEVARMMKEEDTGVIPVVEREFDTRGDADDRPTRGSYNYGKSVGLITDRDIVVRAIAADKDPRSVAAEEIMTTDVLNASPNDRVVDVLRKMADKQVRRVPVVSENGYLRGMIALADIALETEADQELGEALEEISRKSSFWGRIFS